MEEDMNVLMEPLIDAMSQLVSGEGYIDFADKDKLAGLDQMMGAVGTLSGLAMSMAAVAGGTLFALFKECCDGIDRGVNEAKAAAATLGGAPTDAAAKARFVSALQIIVGNMGELLQVHARQFVIRVNQHGGEAKDHIRAATAAVASGNQAGLVTAATGAKTSILAMSKAAAEAVTNTDNERRQQLINEAQADVKETLPAFLVAAQNAANSNTAETQKQLQRSIRTSMNAIDDVIKAVNLSFRDKMKTLSKKGERAVLETTEDTAESLKAFQANPAPEHAKALVMDTAKTVQALTAASKESTDPIQAAALAESAEAVRGKVQLAIQSAKLRDADPAAYAEANEAVLRELARARQAVTGKEGWGLSSETENKVDQATRELAQADGALVTRADPANVQRMAAAGQAAQAALGEAEKESMDPTQKAMIVQAAAGLAQATPKVTAAAQKATANPADPQAQAQLARENDVLLNNLSAARRAVLGNAEEPLDDALKRRVLEETARVERAANKADADARQGNTAVMPADVEELTKAASTAQRGLAAAAEGCADPVQQLQLQQAGQAIAPQAAALSAAADAAAKDPTSAAKQDALGKAHADLIQTVRRAQAAANGEAVPSEPLSDYHAGKILKGVNDSAAAAYQVDPKQNPGGVAAALAETAKAVKATEDATYEAAAQPAVNPQQRAALMDAAQDLHGKAESFKRDANAAAAAPNDATKQAVLAKSKDDMMDSLSALRATAQRGRPGAGDDEAGVLGKKLSPATVGNFNQAADKHAANIEALRATAANSAKPTDDIKRDVAAVEASSADVLAALDRAIAEATDPVQRAQLMQGKARVQRDTDRLRDTADAVVADPKDDKKRAAVAEAAEDALQTLRELRGVVSGAKDASRPVGRATERNVVTAADDMTRAAERVGASVANPATSKAEQASALDHLREATDATSGAVMAAAAETSDADRRHKLMALTHDLKTQSQALDAVAKKAHANPADAAAKADTVKAKDALVTTLDKVKQQVTGNTISQPTQKEVFAATDDVAKAVQECRDAAAAGAPAGADKPAVAHLKSSVDRADRAVGKALEECTDPDWKAQLAAARNKLRPAADKLAAATEASAAAGGNDAAKQKAADDAADEVLDVLRQIRHATAAHKPDSASGSGHISDAAIDRVIKATNKEAASGHKLAAAARQPNNAANVAALVKDLQRDADETVAAALGAAAEANPKSSQGKRIVEATKKVEDTAAQLAAAATKAAQSPNDHAAAAGLARALDNHDAALRQVRKEVCGDDLDNPNLSIPTQRDLRNCAADTRAAVAAVVKAAGPAGSDEELAASSKILDDNVDKTIQALYGAAAESGSIVQKQKLLATASKLQAQADALKKAGAAARRAGAGDRATADALERARQDILKTLDEVDDISRERATAGENLAGQDMEAAAAAHANFLERARKGQLQGGNSDLVAAAAEAASQAKQLCAMAREHARTEPNEEKKQKIFGAADKTDNAADELLGAMHAAAANPNDVAAAKRLDSAYTDLNKNVQEMVGMCYSEAELKESGLADALKQMATAANIQDDAVGGGAGGAGGAGGGDKADQFGRELSDFLENKFLKSTPADTRDYVKWAREAAADAEKFLKELDKFIEQCEDPQYKEMLKKLRRTIKDRSIQLKILATTKANSNDPEEAKAALQAAAQGLQSVIQESMKTMEAAKLRNRFRKAVGTAMALSKAVKGFKGLLKKK